MTRRRAFASKELMTWFPHRRLAPLAFAGALLILLPALPVVSHAQRTVLDPTAPPAPSRRQRLYLKDGSYQMVMSYKILKDRVRYTSAERGGDTEEIPLDLVDLPATRRWEQRQILGSGAETGEPLDPELAKEEADRASITPVVEKTEDGELRLPLEDSVLALDTFRGTPELVPLAQQSSELNKKTGHGIAKLVLNRASSPHPIVTLKGEAADVQVHVDQPDFFLRVGDAVDLPTGRRGDHGGYARERIRRGRRLCSHGEQPLRDPARGRPSGCPRRPEFPDRSARHRRAAG